MTELAAALRRGREAIAAALADARAELAELDARRAELQALIAEADTALGGTPEKNDSALTLHLALAQVLRENRNEPMTARALADAVNARGLYRKRDGSPVEVNQVHARTANYPDLFEKAGSQILLKGEPPMNADYPPDVTPFKDDDQGFLTWLDHHPAGYFINADRNPKPKYLILHRPGCPHIDRARGLHLTKDYIKICADDRAALEEWAGRNIGGEPTLCPPCFR
jgi:hypothetical protein